MPLRCGAARCGNVKDTENGLAMHKIPFNGETCPIKLKKVKKMDQFCVGAKEELGAETNIVHVLTTIQRGGLHTEDRSTLQSCN